MYAAQTLAGAFVETTLRRARRIVARTYVEQRQWTVLSCRRNLALAKLFDTGLLWHGVTADICAGDDYASSQQFVAELHAAFPAVDGIAYRARHNNGQICYAIFDRLDVTQFEQLDARLFKNERATAEALMRQHGAVWDPVTPLPPTPAS